MFLYPVIKFILLSNILSNILSNSLSTILSVILSITLSNTLGIMISDMPHYEKFRLKYQLNGKGQRTLSSMTVTSSALITCRIERVDSSSQDWMVQPAWYQVLAVAARQTICHGEIRMKTFSIGLTVLCDMPMPNIILVIGSNGR